MWKAVGKGAAHRAFLELKMLPVKKVDVADELLLTAGLIKACHPLSVADSWVAATAAIQEAILVHKDPEFEPLAGWISLKALPYK